MKWTRTRPRKEGRYGFRGFGTVKIVTIAFHSEAVNDPWRVCTTNFNEYGTALCLFQEKDCEWSDCPIPLPDEN